MLLHAASVRAARRRMAQHQHKPAPYSQHSLLWLLVLEVRDLARAVGFKRVIAVAIITAASVLAAEVAFASTTPGPALSAPWRWLVAAAAVALVLAGWALRRAYRETRPDPDAEVGPPAPSTKSGSPV